MTLKPKRKLIDEIHASGREVVVEIVRSNLRDEKTAYEVEAAVIDALRNAGRSDLSLQIAGHGHASHGWSSLEALRELAPTSVEIPPDMRPCVLIRPRKKYRYSMTVDECGVGSNARWLDVPTSTVQVRALRQ